LYFDLIRDVQKDFEGRFFFFNLHEAYFLVKSDF